ncbi:hypothetical protein GGTG_01981 [Gaeumannomyces tritici R3-111a-1]|uniref:Uncharacterized protein n=1 Tax=Gaeumannomyces tritici (strain R3-111a-1) TaxID=644352 RepID=J3NL40_GAET3|nr:hypothetical protein GGTG_01981 [Gaeumannomyces tritici R3-111a-1]EJT82007.1 hypothetical protein GGTG_01981 [Gaeumannomyces tritici R3-111a-1]
MPIRNPFARRPGVLVQTDENVRPAEDPSHPGFERVDTVGSKTSSALSITSSRRSDDNGEYKMSVVNDSGVYLPPSPVEKGEPSWPKKYLSRNSEDNRNSLSADREHFTISRESFDSYRRSFDISARSPVANNDTPPTRQSLDSARFPRPRVSMSERRLEPPTAEDPFEDVGLDDDRHKQQHTKRRGFFSKFGSADHSDAGAGQQQPLSAGHSPSAPMVSRFLPGRKRAQSGSQELSPMERPVAAVSSEVPVETQ